MGGLDIVVQFAHLVPVFAIDAVLAHAAVDVAAGVGHVEDIRALGLAGAAGGFAGTLAGGGSLGQAGKAAGIGFGIGATMGFGIGYTYAAGMQDVLHGWDSRAYNSNILQQAASSGRALSLENILLAGPHARARAAELGVNAQYFHYGYGAEQARFAGGLLPGSHGTPDFYTSGSVARYKLQLQHHPLPPDARYSVTVDLAKDPFLGPSPVYEKGTMPPKPTGGTQVIFPKGTQRGSVGPPEPLFE